MCTENRLKLPVTDIVHHSIFLHRPQSDHACLPSNADRWRACVLQTRLPLIETTTPLVGHAAAEGGILDSSSELSVPTPSHVNAADVHQAESISVGPRHVELSCIVTDTGSSPLGWCAHYHTVATHGSNIRETQLWIYCC